MGNLAKSALLLLALASRAPALEISLEENRAQRGNIGYVDMQRIFRLYPETAKAKQSFSEIVHQAEEQVNLRKGELMSIRAELSKLNMERDLLQRTPIPAAPPTVSSAPAALVRPSTAPAAPEAIKPLPSPFGPSTGTAPSGVERLPGMSRPLAASEEARTSSATIKEPLTINIPGVPTTPVAVQPPAAPQPPQPAPPPPPPTPPPPPAPPPPPGPDPTALRNARLKELDDSIAAKIGELGRKEAELKEYEARVEKDLTDVESRRSEILLGKIYTAIREVARDNGVSVIVDKSQIVFGTNTVDLTDKVIKKLEGQ